MRSRSHEVHLAAEDVDELRQLVEPEPAQPLSHPRHVVAVITLPFGPPCAAIHHRPEFQQREWLAVRADALVGEQDRTPRIELDGDRDESEQRRQRHERRQRGQDTQRSRERLMSPRRPELSGRDDTHRCQRFEHEPAGEALVELRDVLDDHAA